MRRLFPPTLRPVALALLVLAFALCCSAIRLDLSTHTAITRESFVEHDSLVLASKDKRGSQSLVWTDTRKSRRARRNPQRPHVFDLSDFGAVGDGSTDNTRAFQNAVYAVSTVFDKGGGQLYVPPGRYLTGCFNLTSSMTLYLARDAVILANPDIALWPVLPPLPSYGRGREMPGPRYSSLIAGQNLTDVVITGENGTVDGQGLFWWTRKRSGLLQHSRGGLIEIQWSSNIIISDITLMNSPAWTLHPVYSRRIDIRNVHIFAPQDAPDTLGFVADSCEDVLFQDCYIRTGGDAVAIKSGWDEYGIACGAASKDITILSSHLECENCAGFTIGTEMSGGIESVLIEHITVKNAKWGFKLLTAPGRGGHIRDVIVQNVSLETVRTAIFFEPRSQDHPDTKFNPRAFPLVENISIMHVKGQNVQVAGQLHGLVEAPFRNVQLEDIQLGLLPGGSGFSCSNIIGKAKLVDPVPCPELNCSTISNLLGSVRVA